MKDQECIMSQIRAMLDQEKAEAFRCIDYLSYMTQLSPDDRRALCTWGFQTIAACNGVSSLTAVRAISYFDRYMGASSEGREAQLEVIQLAFVASLVIALKVDSGFHVELDFVAHIVTKDAYCKEEIKEMEIKILQALKWRLSGPAPHDFIDGFLEAIPGIDATHAFFLNQISKAVAEASIVNYSVALQNPSVIAFSAICFSCNYQMSSFAIDIPAFQHSLKIVSGFNSAESLHEFEIELTIRLMHAIISRELSTFVAARTDDGTASSENSPTSVSGT